MLQGNASTALDRSNTVVLSERMAEKYFGKKSPMGQTLFFNDTQYTVTGVAKNLPLELHAALRFFTLHEHLQSSGQFCLELALVAGGYLGEA